MSEKEMLFLVLQLHDCLPKTQNRPLSFIFMNLIINIASLFFKILHDQLQPDYSKAFKILLMEVQYFKSIYRFNPKKAGGSISAPCGFPKMYFLKRGRNPG